MVHQYSRKFETASIYEGSNLCCKRYFRIIFRSVSYKFSDLAHLSELLGAWIHCVEEMSCLKGFLPDFYRAETARRALLAPFESRMNVDNIISIADIYS